MPAMPKIRDVPSEVREAEIDRELVTKQPRARNRHVGVAGEIAVDLDRVGEHADPRAGGGEVLGRGEIAIGKRRHRVRDARFLDEAGQEQNERAAHIDIGKLPQRLELR